MVEQRHCFILYLLKCEIYEYHKGKAHFLKFRHDPSCTHMAHTFMKDVRKSWDFACHFENFSFFLSDYNYIHLCHPLRLLDTKKLSEHFRVILIEIS